MQKTFSKRINKNTAATLGVIVSAVATVSGNCCSRSRNTARIDASEEILCGSQAEIEATSGPIAETQQFEKTSNRKTQSWAKSSVDRIGATKHEEQSKFVFNR